MRNINKIVNLFLNNDQSNLMIKMDASTLSLLKENKILLRYLKLCNLSNHQLSEQLLDSIENEKNRVSKLNDIIESISIVLDKHCHDYIIFKNFQHYPDMGDDIDILIIDNYDEIKNILTNKFNLTVKKQSILNYLGRKQMLVNYDSGLEIELHNKRLGRLGEFKFNKINIHSYLITRDKMLVPGPELQIVINIIQRLYTRSYFRLSELLKYHDYIQSNQNKRILSAICDQLRINSGLILYNKIYHSLFNSQNVNNVKFNLNNSSYIVYKNNLLYIKYIYSLPLVIKRLFNVK